MSLCLDGFCVKDKFRGLIVQEVRKVAKKYRWGSWKTQFVPNRALGVTLRNQI